MGARSAATLPPRADPTPDCKGRKPLCLARRRSLGRRAEREPEHHTLRWREMPQGNSGLGEPRVYPGHRWPPAGSGGSLPPGHGRGRSAGRGKAGHIGLFAEVRSEVSRSKRPAVTRGGQQSVAGVAAGFPVCRSCQTSHVLLNLLLLFLCVIIIKS